MFGLRCRLLQYQFRYFLFHVIASRFLSSSGDKIRQLLKEKDSKNTKRTYKVAQQVFHEYLLEKGIAEPTERKKSILFVSMFIFSAYNVVLTSKLIIPHITKTSSNNCLLSLLNIPLSIRFCY